MESDLSAPSATPAAPPEAGVSFAEGAGLLVELSDALRLMEQATAKAVDLVGRVQRAGVSEIIEGLPLELLLRPEHRLVCADSGMLLEAARVLNHLPVTKSLFDQQKLSWGQVGGIVARLRRLKIEDWHSSTHAWVHPWSRSTSSTPTSWYGL
jgi:hypothetical protein